MKHFLRQILNNLPRNSLKYFVNDFVKKFRNWTINSIYKNIMNHTWVLLMKCTLLTTLSACFHEPLDHACPSGMTRQENFICAPNDAPQTFTPTENAPTPEPVFQGVEEELPPQGRCPENPASLAFHEVLIDPEGPDQGREWVEFQVLESGVLDGMQLVIRDTLLDDPSMAVALRGKVQPQSLVLVADDQPQSIAFGCKTHGGCLRNTGGVLELLGCDGALLDQITWGYAASNGLKSASGYSFSWCETTERWAQSRPTPGNPAIEWRNEDACPAPCAVPPRLVFNEVLYDLVGPDGGGEFIELIGEPNMPITQVTLWAINGHDGEPFLRPMVLEGSTDADGFYLIGGDEIEGRDHTLPGQLQNGPEALYLEACDGTWLDTMTYGGFTDHLAPYGEASPVLPPGQSLGRAPDGATPTGTMADFFAMLPTPRAFNRLLNNDGP